jgi:putative PIN family toxin of toxin-antitoxin system
MHVLARTQVRLILDTNVWLDWLVFDDPSVGPIKAAVAANRAQIFIDAACAAELERALGYDLKKFSLDAEAQGACLAECRRVTRSIDPPVPEIARARLPACRDPDDQKFLEAALFAGAEFLVTKDKALLELAPRAGHRAGNSAGKKRRALPFRIVTPEDFAGACAGDAMRPPAAPLRTPASHSEG